MELALATKKPPARTLHAASRHLLLLVALGYGICYIVPACMRFASEPANEEPSSSTFIQDSGFERHTELVCEPAPSGLRERIAADLTGHFLNSARLQPVFISFSLLCRQP